MPIMASSFVSIHRVQDLLEALQDLLKDLEHPLQDLLQALKLRIYFRSSRTCLLKPLLEPFKDLLDHLSHLRTSLEYLKLSSKLHDRVMPPKGMTEALTAPLVHFRTLKDSRADLMNDHLKT